jgi:GT2 family glycosyltransferase
MVIAPDQAAAVDVSICVVNWNGERLLGPLLDSVAAAAARCAVEVIVVDNASGDGSAALLRGRFPRVRLIENETNAGFSRANNQAAAVARGRHLFFLNNDTELRPGAADLLCAFLDGHPDVVAVGPRLAYPDGRFQPSCFAQPRVALALRRIKWIGWLPSLKRAAREQPRYSENGDRDEEVQMIIGAALAVRRSAFEACGRWDERYAFCVEDHDLCARLAKLGRLMFVHEAEVMHHGSASASSNYAYAYANREHGCIHYLRRHDGRRWFARFYKLLVTLDQPVRMASLLLRLVRFGVAGRRQRVAETKATLAAAARFTLLGLPRYWWT